ncbi:aminotransferase class III-fold pyridoxal phosphate-dependent enzyme [Candidatus Bathyarchaeota archaeon]|nr:aminotransferase class III-fold pyridoxal phosphate-dependent enzyme [Candidatus Bathyarchaeota archaeon]
MKSSRRCREVVERDRRIISQACRMAYYPFVIEKGEGSKVWDLDGNEYIDFLTGAAVNNIGHCHPEIVKAIREQSEKFIHNTLGYSFYELPVLLAEKLASLTPGSFRKRVAYSLSGSDANDGAIKLARSATGRQKIISFLGSYHGTTYGALTLTASALGLKKRLGPLLPEVYHVPYADCYRCYFGLEYPECGLHCIGFIESLFKILIPAEEVAAFVLEPIQGDAGVIIPPREFLREIKRLCEENGILYVDEEVQTGFGRSGKMFAIEHYGIEPDVLIVAKAIASGLPMGALISKSELMEEWIAPAHLFTAEANPIVCAASLATINVVEKERLPEKAEETGKRVMRRFEEMKERLEIIGDIRGKGLLIGIDLVKDAKKTPARQEAMKTCYRAWERGLIMISFGRFGNVLRIAPPLNISPEDLEKALDIIEESIIDVVEGRVSDSVLGEMSAWG